MKTDDQLAPTVFVIFGGAGDLAWRKLVPAPGDPKPRKDCSPDMDIAGRCPRNWWIDAP